MNAIPATAAEPASPLEFALAYARLGHAVFPLHGVTARRCTCADPDCRSPGKHPRTAHGAHDASTDPDVLTRWWTETPSANVGMALTGLAVVDVDPRNGGDGTLEILTAKHGALPDTATALTGGGGVHYLYLAPPDVKLPGALGKGVDLKHGPGAYIVVAPSIHASGVAYAWEASSDLLNGMLPVSLPDWIATRPTAAAGGTKAAPRVVGLLPTRQKLALRSALNYIPPDERDTWLTVGMALHSTSAADAFAIWTEWSQLSDKYRADDQRRVWNSFKPDGKTHVETIFALAQARGWINPDARQATQFDEATTAAIAAANARIRIEPVEPPAPTPVPIFPVPALNELAAWIDSRYPLTHPAVTRQTVLALAALAASRIYAGDGGTPCHLCLSIIAESAMLTGYARDAIAKVLDACGLRRLLRGTRANVPSNVYSMLWRSPAAIHVVTDFGHLATFARRQPSGVLDQAFAVMAEAYGASAIYLDSAVEAGLKPTATDDQLVIRNPALTTLLLSTNAQMGALLQSTETSRGLLAYHLPALANTGDASERTPCDLPFPVALRTQVRAVRRLPTGGGELSMQDLFGAQPWLKPNLVRVHSERSFDEHAAAIRGVSADPRHRVLLIGAVENARRMTNALAPWRDPVTPVVTRDIMDWVTSYVIGLVRDWLDQFDLFGNDDGRIDVSQRVLAVITERKTAGVPRGKLHMSCRSYRNLHTDKRKAVIEALLEDGDLVEYTPEGQRGKVLVAAKFARLIQIGGGK